MPTSAPRRLARLTPVLVAVLCGLLLAAPAAQAGLSTWSSLIGLSAPIPSWVRVYTTGTPPTTIYAGSEGDGVFRSLNSGLNWTAFGTLPSNARDIRTIYLANGKVYAGTGAGLFSTPTSGGAWTPVAQGPEDDPGHATKLNESPQAIISLPGGTMLAGVVSGGVFRSADSGATWTPPTPANGMPDSTTVWGLANFAGFVWAATSDGIYRSLDFGATWTLSSDGIPASATTLNVFADAKVPTIYYAATSSSGLYRTLNGGITWQPLNLEDFGGSSTPTIRAVQEFSGDKETRLYTATSDGVWIATVPNVTLPGPLGSVSVPGKVSWRHLTESGLGTNTTLWALSNFTTTPGTLLAGTQSNGGYALTLEPVTNQSSPSWIGAPAIAFKVGEPVVGTQGSWNGSPEIDYEYQWQRCSGPSSATCTDIADATDQLYTFSSLDLNSYYRFCVSATNDFPEPIKALHTTCSSVSTSVVGAEAGPLPGESNGSAPSVKVSPVEDQFLPTEGDTLSAPGGGSGWLFNPPATSVTYQWQRCDENGNNCKDIPGAKNPTYKLTFEDNGLKIRVLVTGHNANGSATLPISGATNQVIPLPAANVSPPTLIGTPYVGSSLVGGVGVWKSPATFYERRWERCEADGSDCEPIIGQTGPGYVLQAADYGMTVRMRVRADVNPEINLPLAVETYTPLSAVIQYPPGVTPPPPPGPGPGPAPLPTPPVPKVSSFKLVKSSTGAKLSFKLSGVGSVRVRLQRATAGHKAKGTCVAGSRRHATRCTYYATVLTLSGKNLGAGPHSLSLPTKVHGHPLKSGVYRAVITPLDAAGKKGTPRTISLTLRR